MKLRYLAIILIPFLLITGCSDSGTDSGSDTDGLAVRAVNTGSGDLEIESDSEAGTAFCYDDEGCESLGGFSFHTIYEDNESLIFMSQVDKQAVGVKVGFRVTAGQGRVEVINGSAYSDDAGFREFDEGDVIHTSDTFSEGDVVQFSVGETN